MFARFIMFSFMVFIAHSALACPTTYQDMVVQEGPALTDKSLEIRGHFVRDLR